MLLGIAKTKQKKFVKTTKTEHNHLVKHVFQQVINYGTKGLTLKVIIILSKGKASGNVIVL